MSVWNLNGESSSKKFVNHGGECPDILWLHMLKPCLGSLILHFLPCGDILTYLAEDDFFCVSKNLRLAMCTIVMYYHFFCFSSCILYCSQPFPASCELSNWGSDLLNLSSSPEISRTRDQQMEIPLAFRLFISSDSPGVLCNLGILMYFAFFGRIKQCWASFFLRGRYGVLPQMFIKGM
jgi:hypothetical protein